MVLVGMSTGWIVDSGATSHMCTSKKLFVEYRMLQKAEMVTVGECRRLEVVGCGMVCLWMKLPDEKIKSCQLQEVLHVPDLTYNLVSVSKVSKAGKMTKFDSNDMDQSFSLDLVCSFQLTLLSQHQH